ncbi:thiamine pyrophosphate-binding protein [Shigella flexneri]
MQQSKPDAHPVYLLFYNFKFYAELCYLFFPKVSKNRVIAVSSHFKAIIYHTDCLCWFSSRLFASFLLFIFIYSSATPSESIAMRHRQRLMCCYTAIPFRVKGPWRCCLEPDGRPIAHPSGWKQVFSYPGGAVLDMYDALRPVGGIDHVLVRHEQAAVYG